MEETSENIFLTGKAGTGKSTFIREFSQSTHKKHVILAPTGLAALNINGQTIHSFFKLPLRPFFPGDLQLRHEVMLKISKNQRKLINELDLIIIDEVSMVRADVVDAIDLILRSIRHCNYLPFGGIQILFVGDLYQIEPVVKSNDWDILRNFYPSLFFFNAFVFEQFPLISIELNKVYRQKDEQFISILDRIRIGRLEERDLSTINQRVKDPENLSEEKEEGDNTLAVILSTTRGRVNEINDRKLNTLPTPREVLLGRIEGVFPDSNMPTDLELVLKEGAQVIFTANDTPNKRWVNGTLGVLTRIDPEGDSLEIVLENGEIVEVSPYTWSNKRYFLNEEKNKIEEEILGSFTQFPIKLAWAITIHKSQGLTFDKVEIDLRSGVFAKGQTYVALSRCRSLEGISLYSPLASKDLRINPIVETFYRTTNNQDQIQDSISKAQALGHAIRAAKLWDSKHTAEAIDSFAQALIERPEWVQEERNIRLLKYKMAILSKERKELLTLKKELIRHKKKLQELSQEYLQMARMIPPFTNSEIALRNCEKAIDLFPDYADAWAEKATILGQMNKNKEAVVAIEKALQLSPIGIDILSQAAEVFLGMQQNRKAIEILQKLLSIAPKNREALQRLIRLYKDLGEDDEAERLMGRLS